MTDRPTIDEVSDLDKLIFREGTPAQVLVWQGILRSHEALLRGDQPQEHKSVPWSPTGKIDSPVTCVLCGKSLYYDYDTDRTWKHLWEREATVVPPTFEDRVVRAASRLCSDSTEAGHPPCSRCKGRVRAALRYSDELLG
jgi:hypothetical protein